MRRYLWLVAITVALFLGAGAALATTNDSPPGAISSASQADPTGDAGSGPDITSLTASVSTAGILTLSVTAANGVGNDQSVQFFITTPSGGELDIAQFDDGESLLSVWTGSDWQSIHGVSASHTGNTFTVSDSLSDLQDAVHTPVQPALSVSVNSYIHADAPETPIQADADPDTGSLNIATVASTPPATSTTTTSPPPPPTPSTGPWPNGYPSWNQKIVRLSKNRIEWTRLTVTHVPAGRRSRSGARRDARSRNSRRW